MKIDWKFWLFLLVFLISQTLIAVSLQIKINTETQLIINTLSNQIACQLDKKFCGELEGNN